MSESKLFLKFKDKLGKSMGSYVLNAGINSFGIRKFENGFALKKRGGEIILDRLDLMCLRDIIDKFEKRTAIVNKLD